MGSAFEKSIKGVAWSYMGFAITGGLNLLVIGILARQLDPSDFGIFALARVSLSLFAIIATRGVSEFVIYDQSINALQHAKAAFWIDVAFSLLCTLLGIISLPVIVGFFNEPGLYWILAVMFVRFTFDSFSKVPDALIRKELNFKVLEIRNLGLSILGGILSIVFALNGFGIWSLVLPKVITSPLRALIVYRLTDWRPGFNLYTKYWRNIFKYSANLIGSSLTSFFLREGDSILIGKLIGSAALGIYNVAWQLANLVVSIVTGVVNKVAFPALAKSGGDKQKLAQSLGQVMRLLSIITFPLLIGMIASADQIIYVIYGSKWTAAIIPLQILLVYAIRLSIGSAAGLIFKVVGRPDILFKIGLGILPIYAAGILIGSYYGLVGIALGVTIVRTSVGIFSFYLIGRQLGTGLWQVVKPVMPSLTMASFVGLLTYILNTFLSNLLHSHLAILSILMVVNLGVYILLFRTYWNGLAMDVVQTVQPILKSKTYAIRRILNVQNPI